MRKIKLLKSAEEHQESITELLGSIAKIKAEYDKEREKDIFNIVTALHRERDEVNLHSRIISYLLSPDSGHGMKGVYAELFVREVLKLNEEKFSTSSGLEVLPNEKEKSEYKHIDILLVNKEQNTAIIIENKMDALDSNNLENEVGYRGQLERYYNTIKKGVDKDGKRCAEYESDNVYVYYLSIAGKQPSETSVGMLDGEPKSWRKESIITYETHIREWLDRCIQETPDEKSLERELIKHYLKLVDKITNNDIANDARLELKKVVAGNIESTKYLIENFKHIKWHATHEFWMGLKDALQEENYGSVNFYLDDKVGLDAGEFRKIVTQITHTNINKEINYGLSFELKSEERAYISGKGKLTWGVLSPKKWAYFEDRTIENINFSGFSSKSTYQLIDGDEMRAAVKKIVKEIMEAEDNDLANLNRI